MMQSSLYLIELVTLVSPEGNHQSVWREVMVREARESTKGMELWERNQYGMKRMLFERVVQFVMKSIDLDIEWYVRQSLWLNTALIHKSTLD